MRVHGLRLDRNLEFLSLAKIRNKRSKNSTPWWCFPWRDSLSHSWCKNLQEIKLSTIKVQKLYEALMHATIKIWETLISRTFLNFWLSDYKLTENYKSKKGREIQIFNLIFIVLYVWKLPEITLGGLPSLSRFKAVPREAAFFLEASQRCCFDGLDESRTEVMEHSSRKQHKLLLLLVG